MIELIVWEVLCTLLFWSVFYRLAVVDKKTQLGLRLALLLVGLAALFGFAAPLYDWWPKWPTLLIVGAVVILQLVTSKAWQDGVPHQYRPKGDKA